MKARVMGCAPFEGKTMKRSTAKKKPVVVVTKVSPAPSVRVRTSIKAGDLYLHNPRGSNDRLNSP